MLLEKRRHRQNLPNDGDTKSLSFFTRKQFGEVNEGCAVVYSRNALLFHLYGDLCHGLLGNLTLTYTHKLDLFPLSLRELALTAILVKGDVKSGIRLYTKCEFNKSRTKDTIYSLSDIVLPLYRAILKSRKICHCASTSSSLSV